MRVVVADATAHVRSALQLLLEQHPGVTCVAELSSGDGLVGVLDSVDADVLLVDSHVPKVELGSLLATLAGELDGELPVHAVFAPGAGTSR